MNAVTSLSSQINANVQLIPTGRFEPLSVAGATVAELLQPLTDEQARKCFLKLTTVQPRLKAERLAAELAMEALTTAKAELRRVKTIAETKVDLAMRIGDFFEYTEISDFENQDDAWIFTVEGLVTAFRARGEQRVADRLAEILAELQVVTDEFNRATAEYARATTAFSIEYRTLSSAINFGRAVLAELGVPMPRAAPKKKAKPSPTPAVVAETVPAPAPTPMPAPTPLV
ncbi:MAG: hypothetical protein DI536_34415 [Archangium gephyra]|uniref:Uncharacterized protein n=1 Tax=Archangium gephyra TaxID=48 RepID=A0A2W5U671_9BACT|nr:MAG: hypothetical protein DI536_34415 [Archangium gephyra]